MLEMPEAAPVSFGSTEDVDAADAGPFAIPSPIAISTSGATKATYIHDAPTKTRIPDPIVAIANPNAPNTEIAKQPSVGSDTQPQLVPSLSARTSGTSRTAIMIVPRKSIDFERFGSRDSRTVRIVSGIHAAAIAASIQNSPCQPLSSTSTPPTRGPAAAPAAEAAPQSVIARICPAPAASTDNRLMPHARIVEPAAPWIIRPAMTPLPESERAISTH